MVSASISKSNMLFVNANSKVKSKEPTSKKADDFQSVMENSTNAEEKPKQVGKQETDSKRFPEKEQTQISQENPVVQKVTKAAEPVVKEESQMVEDVLQFVEQVVSLIQNQLQVSIQDIEEAMDHLELTGTDLLETGNLPQLMAELSNATVYELLTDTQLSADVQEVLAQAEEWMTEFQEEYPIIEDITDVLPETDIRSLLEEMKTETVDSREVSKEEFQEKSEELPTQSKSTAPGMEETATELPVIKVENTTQSQFGETMGQSSSQEQIQKPVGNVENSHEMSIGQEIIQNLEQAMDDLTPEEVKPAEIVRQVVEEIRVSARQEMTTMELQLNPEHLGKVSIQVTSRAGILTAQISTETEAARQALDQNMLILKENLEQQGVKVEAIEVTIASHEFEQNLQKGDSQSKGNDSKQKKHFSEEEIAELTGVDATMEEQLEQQIMQDSGSTISYKA